MIPLLGRFLPAFRSSFRRFRSTTHGLMAALIIGSTTGCAMVARPPVVTIADVRVASLGLTRGTAQVELEVHNPNRFDLSVRSLTYSLDVEQGVASDHGEERWVRLAAEDEAERILTAPSRQTVRVAVPVAFEYRALGAALQSILMEGEVRYRVQGTVRVRGPLGERRIPFDNRGRMTP